MRVRYTPKGRGTLDGMKPGDEREVSIAYFQQYQDRLTPLDADPAPVADESEPDDEPMKAIDAIKFIGSVEKIEDLAPFLSDDRKSVRDRAEAKKRVLSSGDADRS